MKILNIVSIIALVVFIIWIFIPPSPIYLLFITVGSEDLEEEIEGSNEYDCSIQVRGLKKDFESFAKTEELSLHKANRSSYSGKESYQIKNIICKNDTIDFEFEVDYDSKLEDTILYVNKIYGRARDFSEMKEEEYEKLEQDYCNCLRDKVFRDTL